MGIGLPHFGLFFLKWVHRDENVPIFVFISQEKFKNRLLYVLLGFSGRQNPTYNDPEDLLKSFSTDVSIIDRYFLNVLRRIEPYRKCFRFFPAQMIADKGNV